MTTAGESGAQKDGFVQVRKLPTNELRRMRVQEVGLVPYGANARIFPIVKADGDTMSRLKMSGQAIKTALGALQELSEKVASTTAIAASAEVDDAAPPPVELGKLFGSLGEMCSGLAKQYAGPAAEEEEEKKKAALEAEKAGKPFPGAAPPFGKKKPEEDDGEEAKKAADCIVTTLSSIHKAGRKMAKARFDALKGAHEAIGKLLAEVGDEEPDSAESGPAMKRKLDAIVSKLDGVAAKVEALTAGSSVTKADAPLDVKAVQEMIAKSAASTQALIEATIAKGATPRTSVVTQPSNGAGGRTETKPPRMPDNLADLAGDDYAHLDKK